VSVPFFHATVTAPPATQAIPENSVCDVPGTPPCIPTPPGTLPNDGTTPPLTTATTTVDIEKFNREVTYLAGQKITYEDGLTVTLIAINDSRCAPDVQCIWAGELSPQLSLTGGDLKQTQSQLSLGTSRTEPQTIGAYTVTLGTTTEDSAVIIVSKLVEITEALKTNTPAPLVKKTAVTPEPVPPPKPKPKPKPEKTVTSYATEIQNLIIEATTKVRQGESLAPFTTDNALARSAKKYSSQLLAGNYLAHIDAAGCDLTCRFSDSGYHARSWGENLAMMEYDEQPSAAYVANFFMTQWQKSAGHRKNLLSSTFTNQGIGVSVQNGKVYVVVHFALPN
jgi:uncharacterized protein YkwD